MLMMMILKDDDDAADDDGDDDEVLKYGKGAPSRETWDFDARDRQQKSSGDFPKKLSPYSSAQLS